MNPTIDIRVGDALTVLRQRPARSVDCVVTSPPYFGLRDYGTGEWAGGDADCQHIAPAAGGTDQSTLGAGNWANGLNEKTIKEQVMRRSHYGGVCKKCGATRVDQQLGMEATPQEYVAGIVEIFREIWRVLADHGTVWLNLGDSYANDTKWGGATAGKHAAGLHGAGGLGREKRKTGLKPKDLIGIPWRVAFALQADGWYLRSDIIWSKPNPMPESVTDRPTKAHEYLFLLTKQPRYYYDHAAIREPAEWARWGDQTNGKHEGTGTAATWISAKTKEELQARATPTWEERKAAGAIRGNLAAEGNVGAGTQRAVHGEGLSHDLGDPAAGRNKRTVWEIPTMPYAEAHFATFPTALVEPCVKAGCPERVCRTCGKPSERISERRIDESRPPARRNIIPPEVTQNGQGTNALGSTTWGHYLVSETVGWTDCGCAYGLEPDALEVIATPTGERADPDPSLLVGRAGMSRPRGENEGRRLITRYEQRAYAAQLKASPHREQMEADAGAAFAHYIRTDTAGARPVPDPLLERWLEAGWLTRVVLPERVVASYRPGVVLDPFMGSGTSLLVARRLGRSSIGIELNPEYADLARRRLATWWRDPSRGRDEQIEGQLTMEVAAPE